MNVNENLTPEELIDIYIQLRDKKEAKDKAFKDDVLGPIVAAMAKIEARLAQYLDEQGLDSFKKNGIGTAYFSTLGSATVKDWEATLGYIREHDLWDLLEARVAKKEVEAIMEETGELPPGVEYKTIRQVRIRR